MNDDEKTLALVLREHIREMANWQKIVTHSLATLTTKVQEQDKTIREIALASSTQTTLQFPQGPLWSLCLLLVGILFTLLRMAPHG